MTNGPKSSAYSRTASSTDANRKITSSRVISGDTPAAVNISRACASTPHSGGGSTSGGGGGRKAPVSLNSSPAKPSLIQVVISPRPPGRQTRTSSAAAPVWSGANIAPKVEMDAVEARVGELELLGVALDPFDLDPRVGGVPAGVLEQL